MISVVIPTYNRCILLEKTLTSLLKQTLSTSLFEVLVIDNGSTDNTLSTVNALIPSIPSMKYIYEPKPGLHSGRHRGLKESKGDILVFADDDIKAFPTWLEGIYESFQDPLVGIVGGKDIPDFESPPPVWIDKLWVECPDGKYMTYFSLLDFGDQIKHIDPIYVFGCNFSIRKEALIKIKGFHPDGMPASKLKFRGDGETHVAQRIKDEGLITVYNPKASVEHWVPASRMNLEYIRKRAFADGITQSYSDIRQGKNYHPDTIRKTLKRAFYALKAPFTDTLNLEIHKSFQQGYDYHQAEIKNDPELLEWVLKEHYLDE